MKSFVSSLFREHRQVANRCQALKHAKGVKSWKVAVAFVQKSANTDSLYLYQVAMYINGRDMKTEGKAKEQVYTTVKRGT